MIDKAMIDRAMVEFKKFWDRPFASLEADRETMRNVLQAALEEATCEHPPNVVRADGRCGICATQVRPPGPPGRPLEVT